METKTELDNDRMYMKRCLQLAANGRATCSPNPMVGAVIVHQGRIIGEGWHRKAGEPHAEPNAIRSVKQPELLKESTMYVSLEPCSHYGKTPPCADLIIQMKIPRVVIGCLDAFPLVAGRGIARMRAAGIEVVVGVEEEACLNLNRVFFHFQSKHRPYVILKWAQTADGYIDQIREPGDQKSPMKISNSFTQMLTHKLRSECDVILVGTNTALLDNPALNVRYWSGKQPHRAVMDRRAILPKTSVLFDGKQSTLVFTAGNSDKKGKIERIQLNFNRDSLMQLMEELYQRNLQTLLVEGGTKIHQSFLEAGLWDEIHVETSTQPAGQGVPAPNLSKIAVSVEAIKQYDVQQNTRKIQVFRPIRCELEPLL